MYNLNYQKQVSSFNHWSRKSYAIFQSLKLQIKISTMSLAMLLVGFGQEVEAQNNQPEQSKQEVSLDTLEVMGELTPVLESEIARPVQIVETASLELSSVNSLQEILNNIPNVDIRQRGNNDVQADISLRGSTFDQVQVLLNGFDMTDPQTGHNSLNLPISFQQIQRVEVLSGSASRVLGPNAYAGAINFVSKRPKNNFVDVGLSAGDFGLYNASLALGFKQKNMTHYVSTSHSQSSGYTNNTDFKRSNLFYFGDYDTRKLNLSWQLAYSDKEFGANSFYTPKYPNQFEELNTFFVGMKLRTKGKISTLSSIHYRANVDRFELFRDNVEIPSWYSNHNYHLTNVLQANTKAWTWWKLGKTTVALNLRNEEIYSNVMGSEIIDTITPKMNPEGFYNKHDMRTYFTASLEHVYVYKKLKVALGMMYYDFPQSTSDGGVYPGIDISYNVNNNIKVYGGVNKGMRLPTFTDLYYQGPSNIGNPDLVAESMISYQIGSKLKYKAIAFSIQAFYNDASNSIDWVRKTDTEKWQPMNITNVKSYGFDIGVKLLPKQLNIDFIKGIGFNYSFLNKETSSPDYESHYVMDYLKNKFEINLEHTVYKSISLGYLFHYYDRMGEFQSYDASNSQYSTQAYNDYGLLDIRLNYKVKSWNFYADLKNVFDKQYQDYGNIIQPGRWFSVGAKYSFIY